MYKKSKVKMKKTSSSRIPDIGLAETRFKSIPSLKREETKGEVRGVLYNVEKDFIDMTLEDRFIATIPINKIKKIKWKERKRTNYHSPTSLNDCRFMYHNDQNNYNCHHHIDACIPHQTLHHHHQCIVCRSWDCNCKNRHHRFSRICDFAIPVCDNRFKLRLAGLNDKLRFDLLQNIGKEVNLELL